MATVDVDRDRVIRTLTFWLRPRFVLRVVSRFQKVVGFDRAVALASSALTAIIPLAIITSSIASSLGGKDTADRIIDRYGLTGSSAEAVHDIFSPSGASTSLGLIGACSSWSRCSASREPCSGCSSRRGSSSR